MIAVLTGHNMDIGLSHKDVEIGAGHTMHMSCIAACSAQTFNSGYELKKSEVNLLWIPNRGNIPPKLERIKLFAAKALAAKVG